MFYHGYRNYMQYAFPRKDHHAILTDLPDDELKPLTRTWSDSLAYLGDVKQSPKALQQYQGIALSLIDSLDTLAILGDKDEFQKGIRWILENVRFDLDLNVHVFEWNIRVLGGLISAHFLAIDKELNLMPSYEGELIGLAQDLATRLLPAFDTATGMPVAFVNLQSGRDLKASNESCTACIGTLILEFGALSLLTKDRIFFDVASKALTAVWENRHLQTGLVGNTIDVETKEWKNDHAGIGAGIDSFYEYLLKAFVLFGDGNWKTRFDSVYQPVLKYLFHGGWYVEANMRFGFHTHVHFNSLQAFFPGVQFLYGDSVLAELTMSKFFSLWKRFTGLPERYILSYDMLHSSENRYPLRPELMESTYFAYRSTRHPKYLDVTRCST